MLSSTAALWKGSGVGISEIDPERDALIWELRAVKRWSQLQVAKHLGISQQRVSQIEDRVRAELPDVDRAQMIRNSIALHEHTIRRLQELADMDGAPVTAGKDGDVVYDPDTGAAVRDYALRVNAHRALLAAEAELRRLLGLDAATKVESTATVKYELVGVDPDELA